MQVVGIRGANSGSSVLRVSMKVGTCSSRLLLITALLYFFACYLVLPACFWQHSAVIDGLCQAAVTELTCGDTFADGQVEFLKSPGLLRQVIEAQAKKEAMAHWWVGKKSIVCLKI